MVEQLGKPGRRHVLSAGSFENTTFWNTFLFREGHPCVGDTFGGMGYVATRPNCGPQLILSPAM